MIVEAAGLKVGLVAVMVPMVTKRMATQAASAYLWQPPVAAAIAEAALIRDQVDCLIALTHIGLSKDRELAEKTDAFDLILGGHSHSVLQEALVVGSTAICQAGSHARYAGVYGWEQGRGLVEHRLVSLLPG
jgi:2',3'-cyclic-nucleotide 2'-phosphodiesterase (5'-nucleotidase family)